MLSWRVHLPLGKVHLWSKAHALFRPKLTKYGQRLLAEEAGFCRNITTSIGDYFSGYGGESPTKSVQKQIVDALYLGERGRASGMLLDLGLVNNLSKADDFIDILKYCATSPDPLFAMETWKMMEEKEIGPSNVSCLLMMQALCGGGYLDEAYNLINFIGEKHGMTPSLAVYNSFLEACSKMHNIVHANKCLDLMERRMSGKNEQTYMVLLKLAVYQQNLPAVHEIWKDYTKFYSPTISSLHKFINSFTKLRDLNSACETLQYMVSLALREGNTFSNTSGGMPSSSRLDIPIPSNVESSLSKANVHMENIEWIPSIEVLQASFGDVIHACAQMQNSELAEQLMLQMQSLRLNPSSHTFDGFLRAILPARGISEVMEMLKIMQERNLKPYNLTLAVLSMVASNNLELDLAESLLDQNLNHQNRRPYNVFLEACDAVDQPERAVKMLAKMRQLKIQPDIRTYELMFSLFGKVNAPYEDGNLLSHVNSAKRINAIEMDMKKNGVQHSHLSMKNLLKVLGAEGMMKELIQYLRMAEDLFCRTNTYFGTPIYNTVLHSLVEAKESHLAIEIFKNMKSSGFRVNAATYTSMIDCCSIIKCYKSASALFSLMLRDGFYPQVATYTALVKVALEDENFHEALNVLDQAKSAKIQLDELLYNTFLRKAQQMLRIDMIELIVEQMHREKIKPDSGTCNYVFTTYVSRGFHNTAMEALQVLGMRMIGEEYGAFEQKKAEFEDDFILSEDPEVELRILERFGGPEENISVALLNLRWCAIAGVPICWSPNESQWARRLSTNYDTINRRYVIKQN